LDIIKITVVFATRLSLFAAAPPVLRIAARTIQILGRWGSWAKLGGGRFLKKKNIA